ncbi:hypothetical protein [Ammoniphilus sp. 3BR4]|uniref:hypothetical protein n=1 Tax=Ammoniphilus sp. 3BR4 TaxID=3158265 RepID=UPI003466F1FB
MRINNFGEIVKDALNKIEYCPYCALDDFTEYESNYPTLVIVECLGCAALSKIETINQSPLNKLSSCMGGKISALLDFIEEYNRMPDLIVNMKGPDGKQLILQYCGLDMSLENNIRRRFIYRSPGLVESDNFEWINLDKLSGTILYDNY